MPPADQVRTAYHNILADRGLAPTTCNELCLIESPESQWQHVFLAKIAVPSGAVDPKVFAEQIMSLQYRNGVVLDNLALIRTFIARSSTEWIEAFVKHQGLHALHLFLPQPSMPIVEFNVTRGHAILAVFWRLCHFQPVLRRFGASSSDEAQACLLGIALCLLSRQAALRIKVLRLLRLVGLATPSGPTAVIRALENLDKVRRVAPLMAELLQGDVSIVHDQVFSFLVVLLEAEASDDNVTTPKWLSAQLRDASVVDVLGRNGPSSSRHALRCRELVQADIVTQSSPVSEKLAQLVTRAKSARAESALLQIVQSLMAADDPEATWQQVAARLTHPPSSPAKTRPPQQSTKFIKAADHPKYAKYFKMLQVRVPEDLVRQRMIADGVDEHMLATPTLIVGATASLDGNDDTIVLDDVASPRGSKSSNVLSPIHAAQVLTIVDKLPFPLAQLGFVIARSDASILTNVVVDKLLVLLAIPSQVEKDALADDKERAIWSDAERAVHLVQTVANPLLCWQSYWQFPALTTELRDKCACVQAACEEISQSTALFELLQIGVELELYTAFGWTLLSEEERSSRRDDAASALDVLAETLREKNPSLLQFGATLQHLPKAVAVSSADLQAILAEQHTSIQFIAAHQPTQTTEPWTTFLAAAHSKLHANDALLAATLARLDETVAQCFGHCAFPRETFFQVLHHLSNTMAASAVATTTDKGNVAHSC
ncbi:Aste57867_18525 [Aphanomyces stellatus]|uniref:Aste57867_18525 protein n=1 Tax=Aphanomyces stellatus TaxID=120398 RepID=A0A485LAB8_9STRA|nr:hypothetical protein As57867_018463 [Aphanomyces stellatus]VFT95261.1 Aste57867_18525 [Aphanomyces stellatus]